MNDSNRGSGAGAAGMNTEAEYRIREVEARLGRRLDAVEAARARSSFLALLSGAGFVIALAALAVVLVTVVPDDREVIAARVSTGELELTDSDGITRGALSTDGQGRARLTLSDRDGRERIGLSVLSDGSPGVTINDSDGQPRAVLAYLSDGTTNLVLADARGVSRAVFGLEPDGSARALFSDASGAVRTLVGVDPQGAPSVSVMEDAGDR